MTYQSYYLQLLSGVTGSTAPFDVSEQPAGESAQTASLHLDASLVQRLRAATAQSGLTLAAPIYLAWAMLLGRCSQRDDVVWGALMPARTGLAGDACVKAQVLPLRVQLNNVSVGSLLHGLQRQLDEMTAHRELELSAVLDCMGLTEAKSLFTSVLVYGAGHDVAHASGAAYADFPLVALVDERDADVSLAIHCSASMNARRIGAYFQAGLEALLQAMLSDAGQDVARLDIMPSSECQQLLEGFNATAQAYPAKLLVHQLFEQQVLATPHATALLCEGGTGGQQLSYHELNCRANRLAHDLLQRGVRPDDRVAICCQRSVEMVVGLLAILKAGAAYVPVDPAYPGERLAYMLKDAAPLLLLTQAHLLEQITAFVPAALPVQLLDAEDMNAQEGRESNPDAQELGLEPGHLAYIIYTSGSTGIPKGVMNQHDGVVNRLLWAQSAYQLSAQDRVLQKTPFGFDVSVWEFFLPLLAGACLVMARPEGHQDPQYLAQVIEEAGITTLHFVPSMLQAFLEQPGLRRCPSLRQVLCSGEALPYALQERWMQHFPQVQLHNLYGPTEAAIDVTSWHCQSGLHAGIVPIGRPIANIRMYILDAHLMPVPVGVAGELYIGGVGVARGYWNQPALTAERFICDPYSNDSQARLYKTGDLGKWLDDGAIAYLGRNDHQVKIRGFRIELGEIESHLLACEGVREAVVLAREDLADEKRLVAYVVLNDKADVVPAVMRRQLAAALPDYMLPAAILVLPAMPTTVNGKLDRQVLPAPALIRAYGDSQAPVGETENILAGMWATILHLDSIGRQEDFFELGGHSLLATRLTSKIFERFAIRFSVRDIFAFSTVQKLAAVLEERIARERASKKDVDTALSRIEDLMLDLTREFQ